IHFTGSCQVMTYFLDFGHVPDRFDGPGQMSFKIIERPGSEPEIGTAAPIKPPADDFCMKISSASFNVEIIRSCRKLLIMDKINEKRPSLAEKRERVLIIPFTDH